MSRLSDLRFETGDSGSLHLYKIKRFWVLSHQPPFDEHGTFEYAQFVRPRSLSPLRLAMPVNTISVVRSRRRRSPPKRSGSQCATDFVEGCQWWGPVSLHAGTYASFQIRIPETWAKARPQ